MPMKFKVGAVVVVNKNFGGAAEGKDGKVIKIRTNTPWPYLVWMKETSRQVPYSAKELDRKED